MNAARLNDEELYRICKHYGEMARVWRQRFAGLLPEVSKRWLYEKKGFGSIFEFAAKLAGMSEEQVRRVLNLEKKFQKMPVLRTLLINGEVSVNKLAKVASIATPENQEVLAEQVKLLPKSAIETLVRDEKYAKSVPGNTQVQQNFQGATVAAELRLSEDASGGSSSGDELQLSSDVKQKLLELQKKGIDINELLAEFLEKREMEIAQEKEQLAQEVNREAQNRNEAKVSQHIPVRVRTVLSKEHGKKCSIAHCTKEAKSIHHTQRFALSGTHDPRFMAPLCKEHHRIAHSIDMKFQENARRGYG